MGQSSLKTHVLIIGGGIVGSGILRDLALHGVETILIDKKDFNSQTSAKSSKMLHGGIRYLETMDFALVSEALHEKNLWLKLTPHLVKEKKFLMPAFKNSKFPLWMLWCGVKLYDALSAFQNKSGHTLNKKKTLSILKGLNPNKLKGAAVYYDSVVDDAKLGLECIYDALLEKNALAFNYTEVLKIHDHEHFKNVLVRNTLTNEEYTIECQEIIFATGPFSDRLIPNLGLPWEKKMILSKGSHLWLKKETLNISDEGMVIQTKEGRVIFVIPEREAILVGTTEVPLTDEDEIFDLKASQDEIDYLLFWLNQYFPEKNIRSDSIITTFSGVRPLVQEFGVTDHSKTSRHHLLYHITPTIHAIMGGKYTTFRVMAQGISKIICERLKIKYNKKKTLSPLRQHSIMDTFGHADISIDIIDQIFEKELAKTSSDIIERRLSLFDDKKLQKHPEVLKKIKEKSS